MRWLRAPLVHFLAGGAALFCLTHLRPQEATSPIVLTAGDVARLRADYTRETGLEPTANDEAALVDKAIQEELLYRAALARGLDRDDRSVRNWLVEQMRVLTDDATDDAERLYVRARMLGLDRTDVVVRRLLVQKMRLVAARTGERDPTDAELAAFYARHADEYRTPDRVSFWHVFVRRGTDVAALLARIRDRPPEEAVRQGDSFPAAPHLIAQSPSEVAKLFGAEFAETIGSAAPRTWTGPVPSPYGLHLVWLEARLPGAPPPLEAVRARVLERWHDEQRGFRVVSLLRDLERRHPLRIESAAWRQRSAS